MCAGSPKFIVWMQSAVLYGRSGSSANICRPGKHTSDNCTSSALLQPCAFLIVCAMLQQEHKRPGESRLWSAC